MMAVDHMNAMEEEMKRAQQQIISRKEEAERTRQQSVRRSDS